jgi:anti-anti-sigma factor
MHDDFLVRVDYRPHTAHVTCAGELDISTERRLTDAVDLVLEDPLLSELIVDLEGVTMLSSPGISALLRIAKACRRKDVAFRLRANDGVRRVLDAVQLWWLGIVDDGLDLDETVRRASRLYAEVSETSRRGDSGAAL